MQGQESFERDLAECICGVFSSHPDIRDHRQEHPWLTGSLGNPYSGIWFLAESPSLRKVEATTARGIDAGRELTSNSQWGATRGSQVLRKALVKAGFKEPKWDSSDGWHCYITNVIKEAVYVKEWTDEKKAEAAETWSPVLRWQLEQSSPKLVVLMGRQVEKLIWHLERKNMISLPPVRKICHYSYIASYAEGNLGPMHPDRIKRYQNAILKIRREFDEFYALKDAW